jgi:broad specificity phosphatase PhoE
LRLALNGRFNHDATKIQVDGTWIDVFYDDRFYERNFGNFYIQSDQDIKAFGKDVFESWEKDLFGYSGYGVESLRAVRNRVIPALKELMEQNPDKNILLMTHKVPFQFINAYAHNILGASPDDESEITLANKDFKAYFEFQRENQIPNLGLMQYDFSAMNFSPVGGMLTFY